MGEIKGKGLTALELIDVDRLDFCAYVAVTKVVPRWHHQYDEYYQAAMLTACQYLKGQTDVPCNNWIICRMKDGIRNRIRNDNRNRAESLPDDWEEDAPQAAEMPVPTEGLRHLLSLYASDLDSSERKALGGYLRGEKPKGRNAQAQLEAAIAKMQARARQLGELD